VIDLALAVVCAALGLIAVPLVFGGAALAWLVVAIALAVCVLVLVPRLSRPVAFALQAQLSSSSAVTPSQTRLVAQLLVVGIALLVVQAMLRRPLSLVLGGQLGATTYEASIAATGLTLVLAIAVWLYQTARPVVQAATLRAIDAAIPTVEAAPLAEPTRTLSSSAPTLAAPLAAGVTLTAVAPAEPTLLAPIPGDEQPTLRRDERTSLRAPAADPDVTVRRERPPG